MALYYRWQFSHQKLCRNQSLQTLQNQKLQTLQSKDHQGLRGEKSLQLQGLGFARLQRAAKPYAIRVTEFAKKACKTLYKYRQVLTLPFYL